jgi:hypothetical protein
MRERRSSLVARLSSEQVRRVATRRRPTHPPVRWHRETKRRGDLASSAHRTTVDRIEKDNASLSTCTDSLITSELETNEGVFLFVHRLSLSLSPFSLSPFLFPLICQMEQIAMIYDRSNAHRSRCSSLSLLRSPPSNAARRRCSRALLRLTLVSMTTRTSTVKQQAHGDYFNPMVSRCE